MLKDRQQIPNPIEKEEGRFNGRSDMLLDLYIELMARKNEQHFLLTGD